MQTRPPLDEWLSTLDVVRGPAANAVAFRRRRRRLQVGHGHPAVDVFFALGGLVVARVHGAKLLGSMTATKPRFQRVRRRRDERTDP